MKSGRLQRFKQLLSRKRLLFIAGTLASAWRLLFFQTSSEHLALHPSPEILSAGALGGSNAFFMFSACGAVVSCIALLLASRTCDVTTSTPCYVAGFALGCAAPVLGPVLALAHAEQITLPLTATVLGLSDGITYALYALNHTRERPDEIVTLVTLESLAGWVLCWCMATFLTQAGLTIATVILIIASGVLMKRHANTLVARASSEQATPVPSNPSTIQFTSFCLLILCFAITRGSVQSVTVATAGSFGVGVIGMIVAQVALLLACLFLDIRSLQSLFLSTIVVMVAGILAIPLYSLDVYLASAIHIAGFSALSILRWGFVPFFRVRGDGAVRTDAAIVCLFTLCSHAGKALGSIFAEAPLRAGAEFLVFLVPMSLLALTTIVILLVFLRQQRLWQGQARTAGRRPDGREAACSLIKERFELTDREGQILQLIGDGRSASQMERALGISHNTIKTHLKHVYAKTGVHTRDELSELIDEVAGRVS